MSIICLLSSFTLYFLSAFNNVSCSLNKDSILCVDCVNVWKKDNKIIVTIVEAKLIVKLLTNVNNNNDEPV